MFVAIDDAMLEELLVLGPKRRPREGTGISDGGRCGEEEGEDVPAADDVQAAQVRAFCLGTAMLL
jgi:hypothetical protein